MRNLLTFAKPLRLAKVFLLYTKPYRFKPMRLLLTALAGGLLLLSACGPSRKLREEHTYMDTVSVSAFNNPIKQYRASATRVWNLVHTRAALSFDYAHKTANGKAWLTLNPYFYATDTLVLDAKGMKIESVADWQNKAFEYTYNGEQLTIKLGRSFRRDDTLKLALGYIAQPYMEETGGSKAITDEKGLYFINTDLKTPGKPAQIWTQGETESNSRWLPTIDKPNSRTTLQLELTVPDSFKTLANGALISAKVKGNMRTDIWKMDKPIQVYAIMFAIGNFNIVKDSWKGRDVHYYVEPEYAPYARSMFRNTPEMMDFFSAVTGVEYPWNKYNQIVVRDYVSGAMENTSASLFGEFVNMDNRELLDKTFEDVVSHELFHQWFGDYTTAESWSNLTVNESFANYGEYLWRRYKYGKVNADQLAYEDLWKYLSTTERMGDPVLVRFHYRDKEDMFDRISYQKGGATLRYLHSLMGDTAFYRAMNLYLTRNALKPAEATHWRLAVEEATGQDWNWFFNQWYLRAGHPELDVTYASNDQDWKFTVTVTQTQDTNAPLYQLPLKAALLYEDGTKQIVHWDIDRRKQSFTYPYRGGKAPVFVPDIDHVLPGIITEHKSSKDWLTQLTRTDDYISKMNAVRSAKTKDLPNADVMALMEKALTDKIADIRKMAVYTIQATQAESQRRKWQPDMIMMATNDPDNAVRAVALYTLGYWKVSGQEDLFLQSLNDSSYQVAGQAMYGLSRLSPDKAYTLAKQYIKGRPGTELDIKSWAVIDEQAQAADTALYRYYLGLPAAGKRDYLINDLEVYAKNVRQDKAFEAALEMMVYYIGRIENKNSRRQYIGKFEDLGNHLQKQKQAPGKDKENARVRLEWLEESVRSLKATETEAALIKRYDEVLKALH
jgi:aminopeptidase N